MARRPRSALPEFGFFHLISRGVDRAPIFLADDDRQFFVGLLNSTMRRSSWECHAYCLMGNHFHLVLEAARDDISEGMQRLNGVYAQSFNACYGRIGHLFQNRFGARLVESESGLAGTCRYVFDNPVRAGLCDQPEDWPWSGGRAHEALRWS